MDVVATRVESRVTDVIVRLTVPRTLRSSGRSTSGSRRLAAAILTLVLLAIIVNSERVNLRAPAWQMGGQIDPACRT